MLLSKPPVHDIDALSRHFVQRLIGFSPLNISGVKTALIVFLERYIVGLIVDNNVGIDDLLHSSCRLCNLMNPLLTLSWVWHLSSAFVAS